MFLPIPAVQRTNLITAPLADICTLPPHPIPTHHIPLTCDGHVRQAASQSLVVKHGDVAGRRPTQQALQ